jgi:GTP cyclohydrolase I
VSEGPRKIKEREIVFSAEEILRHVRPTPVLENGKSPNQKIELISQHFTQIMNILELDLENESLQKTPYRVAKMFVNELFTGMSSENFPKISVIENEMKYDQMVVTKNIAISSTCEHHFLPIHGKAVIAYIPKNRVIGLSKINRVAKYFARRPQVQERLTKQIADCLCYVLDTEDVGVFMDAKHHCVVSRGIEDVDSTATTCDLRGCFLEDGKTRAEFMLHCRSTAVR